jgi:hypothetical protein
MPARVVRLLTTAALRCFDVKRPGKSIVVIRGFGEQGR